MNPKEELKHKWFASRPKTLAVDFDGTMVPWTGGQDLTEIPEPYPGVRESLNNLRKAGWRIIIHSCRGAFGTLAKETMMDWMKKYKISYHDIWEGHGKPMADVYLDDSGLRFNGAWGPELVEAIQEFKPWWFDAFFSDSSSSPS